jgi:translation initiation factor IF-2
VYALARELNMESKDLLDLCRQAGFDVKNQLSSLDPDQRDAVEQMVRKGGGVATAAPPKPVSTPVAPLRNIPILPSKPAVLPSRPTRREPEPAPHAPAAAQPSPTAAPPTAPAEEPAPQAPAARAPETPPQLTPVAPTQVPAASAPAARQPETPAAPVASPGDGTTRTPPDRSRVPGVTAPRIRDLGQQPRPEGGTAQPRHRRDRPIPRPQTVRIAPLPTPKPKPVEEKKPQQPAAQKKLMELPEDVKRGERSVSSITDLMKTPGKVQAPAVADVEITDEEEGADKGKGKRPGGVAGRGERHRARADRARLRKGREQEQVTGRALLTADLDERPQRTKDRLKKKLQRGPTQPRKGKVPIQLPITVRALGEAIGMRQGDLLFRLRDHGLANVNINSTVDPDTAQLIALDQGCELDIKRPLDAEEQLLSSLETPDRPEDLLARPPIVTIMGHVDHGKTTLLDKIRQSNVAATEAGGITQVIRAWRVEHNGQWITFLDTPGHEAFTKMRARGAHVTDIAVIVVAADDGVMPQTEEAINHAKAANVAIVVAINKVDLPNANVQKTRQQLYSLSLLPDNMGGDVPFVETSGSKGTGIDELLENITLLAEVKELKANPTKAARGTCLEAMLTEGEGVFATLLVQDGTLHRGDVVLCGASYGRVRAMYDDLGRPIQDAGPSVPVRITGLDEVPNADDPFQVVPELSLSREVAEKRKTKQQEASLSRREPVRLESLTEAKIAELKVILKADFRGSVEAIRKELEKLHHEEVRVRVLHTGIGAITESDVQLALTSPTDTIIVGFNVVPDDRARALADERGVQIREYDIIYKLTDDIRAALEGKLKPREEVIHLGRAVVRETFKISRVGTIAGCYVTQGTIERSSKVKVIREGVVIYPPADRTVGLESLKRFKEDVREVREGFECGLKIAGYDDIKVGDVIQAYRVEQVQRTLN